MTVFKRRFEDYLSMAKASCEWDALKFDLSTQKLYEFLDVLQKTVKEAFRAETQQFIDKTIYAKMPDHVKKKLNEAYLEDKPYNNIVLHLEREMRLNGLGAPDEITLVPLNKIEATQSQAETKPTENITQNTKKGYCFCCNRLGRFKAEFRRIKHDKTQQTRKESKFLTKTADVIPGLDQIYMTSPQQHPTPSQLPQGRGRFLASASSSRNRTRNADLARSSKQFGQRFIKLIRLRSSSVWCKRNLNRRNGRNDVGSCGNMKEVSPEPDTKT